MKEAGNYHSGAVKTLKCWEEATPGASYCNLRSTILPCLPVLVTSCKKYFEPKSLCHKLSWPFIWLFVLYFLTKPGIYSLRPAQKTSSEAGKLLLFKIIYVLCPAKLGHNSQVVVRGSFINKISQIVENWTQASVCVFGGNDLFRETIIFKFV